MTLEEELRSQPEIYRAMYGTNPPKRPIDRTTAEEARWWREREATERAFLQSNCLTPDARKNSERWVERFARIAAQYEQEGKEDNHAV